ncbi:hypothetical protein CYMTET_4099, partial [Cymbomonas tetramitiformis]
FMDVEEMLVDVIAPEDIREGPTRTIRAVYGTCQKSDVEVTTRAVLGLLNRTRLTRSRQSICVDGRSGSPVWVLRSTLERAREHIAKSLGQTSFQAAFKLMVKGFPAASICQSCILLTFAYHFQHGLYSWHVDNSELDGVLPPAELRSWVRPVSRLQYPNKRTRDAVHSSCCKAYDLTGCGEMCALTGGCDNREFLLQMMGKASTSVGSTWMGAWNAGHRAGGGAITVHDEMVKDHVATMPRSSYLLKRAECRRFFISSR